MTLPQKDKLAKEGRINFLKVRLSITQKDWEKANKKWMNKKHNYTENMDVKAASVPLMTKMCFCNGQRKVLKELIALEESE